MRESRTCGVERMAERGSGQTVAERSPMKFGGAGDGTVDGLPIGPGARDRIRDPGRPEVAEPAGYRPTGCSTSKPANSPPPCAQRVPSSAWATVSKRQPAIVIQTWSAFE